MNQKRFLEKIEPLRDQMYRLSKRLLVSRDAAEDAVQDVYVKLWRKRKTLHNYYNVEAFTLSVTKNHCLDILRLKRSSNLRIVHSNYTDSAATPEQLLENRDDLVCVEALIDALPTQQKMIIQLREIEQLDYDKIAKILNMNETAIRVNLSRARKTLRKKLEQKHNYGLTGH